MGHCYPSEQNVINIFNCTFGRAEGEPSEVTEDEPAEVNISSENHVHTNGGNEFICVHCRNSLRGKKTKNA